MRMICYSVMTQANSEKSNGVLARYGRPQKICPRKSHQSHTQSPQALWPSDGHREGLWGTGILLPQDFPSEDIWK